MTVSYEIQTKSNVSIGLYPNRLYNCYDHGAVGNKLPGIGKTAHGREWKIDLFSDIQQHGEKHGGDADGICHCGRWCDTRATWVHTCRGLSFSNRQAFLVCRGSFMGQRAAVTAVGEAAMAPCNACDSLRMAGGSCPLWSVKPAWLEHTPHLPAALLQDYMHLGAHPPPLNVCCDMELLTSHRDWLKWWAVISWASV